MKKQQFYFMLWAGLLLFSCSQDTVEESQLLFTKIDPVQSGMDFENTLKETKDFNLFTWKYIYNGGGVAVGDINNDGLPDVYFSANAGTNKLYLNKGNFQFEDITMSAKVGTPQGYKTGVSMVDINGDGWLDIYVCRDAHPNPQIRNNLVFINNQDLTFTESGKKLGLVDQGFTTQSVFFDMDQDNDLDLFLVNHPGDFEGVISMRTRYDEQGNVVRKTTPDSRAESYQLYENQSGVFKEITIEAGIAYRGFGLSALAYDFNADGLLDIYVGNDFIEPDALFLNQGNKTFKEADVNFFRHMSQNSMGSDLGDINNDGLLDMVVTDMLAETNERQKVFATNMTQNRYERMVQYGFGKQLMRNVLQLQTHPGRFVEMGSLAGIEKSDWSWSALMADFNMDQQTDLFITNGIKRDMSDKDFIDFQSDSVQRAKQQGIEALNKNTLLDWISLIPSTPLPNHLYLNQGNLTFSNVAEAQGLADLTFSQGAAYADLDLDGDLDLIVNNMDAVAGLYQNNAASDSSHFVKIKLIGESQNPFGIGSILRLNQNNQTQTHSIQSSRGFLSGVEPVVTFAVDPDQEMTLKINWSDGSHQIANDLQLDELNIIRQEKSKVDPIRNPQTQLAKISELGSHKENLFDDFKQEPLLFRPQSQLGPKISMGDVNGDGSDDIFMGGAAGYAAQLWISSGGSYRKKPSPAFEKDQQFEDLGSVFFDVDGDSDLDLYVVSGGVFSQKSADYQDRLYLNDGQGNFSGKKVAETNFSGSGVAVADFNGDEQMDLFVGGHILPGEYPTSPASVILMNESGNLSKSQKLNLGMVTDAQAADINRDGFTDLVVVGEWMPVTMLINDGKGTFTNQTAQYGLDKSSGFWNCLEIKDLNQDGQPELIVGNLGANHPFEISQQWPMLAYQADFDDNGSQETIINHYIDGDYWPLPRKEVLSSVLPAIKKNYLSNRAYGTAKLEDLFSQEQLENAAKYQVFETRSGIFQLKDGKYSFQPFENYAQLFPVFDIAVYSADADQFEIWLGGNQEFSEVEQGPYDAGPLAIVNERLVTELIPMDGNIRSIHFTKDQIIIGHNNGPIEIYKRK